MECYRKSAYLVSLIHAPLRYGLSGISLMKIRAAAPSANELLS